MVHYVDMELELVAQLVWEPLNECLDFSCNTFTHSNDGIDVNGLINVLRYLFAKSGSFTHVTNSVWPHLNATTKYVYESLVLGTLWKAPVNCVPKTCLCFGTVRILRSLDLTSHFVGLAIRPHSVHTITIIINTFPNGLPTRK